MQPQRPVDDNGRGVDARAELPYRRLVLGDDALGVRRAEPANVRDGVRQAADRTASVRSRNSRPSSCGPSASTRTAPAPSTISSSDTFNVYGSAAPAETNAATTAGATAVSASTISSVLHAVGTVILLSTANAAATTGSALWCT